jgi:hypothetical protein
MACDQSKTMRPSGGFMIMRNAKTLLSNLSKIEELMKKIEEAKSKEKDKVE